MVQAFRNTTQHETLRPKDDYKKSSLPHTLKSFITYWRLNNVQKTFHCYDRKCYILFNLSELQSHFPSFFIFGLAKPVAGDNLPHVCKNKSLQTKRKIKVTFGLFGRAGIPTSMMPFFKLLCWFENGLWFEKYINIFCLLTTK